nr:hypothetical protein TorRG33x02_203650 [Ipomoea batatas]
MDNLIGKKNHGSSLTSGMSGQPTSQTKGAYEQKPNLYVRTLGPWDWDSNILEERKQRVLLAALRCRLVFAGVLFALHIHAVDVGAKPPDAERGGDGLGAAEMVAVDEDAAEDVDGHESRHADPAGEGRGEEHHPGGAHEAELPRHQVERHREAVSPGPKVEFPLHLRLHFPEPAAGRHPHHGKRGGGHLHHQLHFHHHGVAVDLRVNPLHYRQIEGEQQPGPDR